MSVDSMAPEKTEKDSTEVSGRPRALFRRFWKNIEDGGGGRNVNEGKEIGLGAGMGFGGV